MDELYRALDSSLEERTGAARFDILVNNAGIGQALTIEEMTEEAFDEVMAVNVKAPLFLIRQALPRVRWVTGQLIDASGGTHL